MTRNEDNALRQVEYLLKAAGSELEILMTELRLAELVLQDVRKFLSLMTCEEAHELQRAVEGRIGSIKSAVCLVKYRLTDVAGM